MYYIRSLTVYHPDNSLTIQQMLLLFFPTYSLNGKVLKFWFVSYKQSLWTSRNSLWPGNLTTNVEFSLVRFWCNSPDSITSHLASKPPCCCVMRLKITVSKWLPFSPVASELINCRHIGDKAYLYRPNQITEGFSIFLSVIKREVYHLTNKFLLTCLAFGKWTQWQ